MSDSHLRTDWTGLKPSRSFTHKYIIAAFEYFKSVGVDAVVHLGDMAHRGQSLEMQFHADAWKKVFGDSGPIKLFVTGNHDAEGGGYGDFAAKVFPDETERAKHLLATDMATNWERIWGEPYLEVWHKEVKGYHFFGRNWTGDEMDTVRLVKENAVKWRLNGNKPFFLLMHLRPNWRKQRLCDELAEFRNAVGFFGHAHVSNSSWGTLEFKNFPLIQCGALTPGGENHVIGIPELKLPIEGVDVAMCGASRHGMIVRVYDKMLTIERRELGEGGSLGADWVMPFGRFEPHPFSAGELKNVIGKPQFGKIAKLKVESVKLKGGEDAVRVLIPLADGNPDSRVYAYHVVVVGEARMTKLEKVVCSAGCNAGIGREPNGGVTTLDIPKSELPPGKKLAISVRPLSSLGTSGKAIIARLMV